MLFIDDKVEHFRPRWNQGELKGEHHRALDSFLGRLQTHNFVVVCESFEHRPHMEAAELISNEYIGVVKYFQQERNANVVWQTKSYGCKFFDDKKLKKLDKYWPTKGGHANDAMRHLLQWLTFGPLSMKEILEELK